MNVVFLPITSFITKANSFQQLICWHNLSNVRGRCGTIYCCGCKTKVIGLSFPFKHVNNFELRYFKMLDKGKSVMQ